jgi:hypothetical protein
MSLGLALTTIKSDDWTLLCLTSRPCHHRVGYSPARSSTYYKSSVRPNGCGAKNCRVSIPRDANPPFPWGQKSVAHHDLQRSSPGEQLEVPHPSAGVNLGGRVYQTGTKKFHPIPPKAHAYLNITLRNNIKLSVLVLNMLVCTTKRSG